MSEPPDPTDTLETGSQPTDRAPTVRALGSEDLESVARLLARHDLPVRDIHTEPIQFVGVERDGDLVGVGGLERYGRVGLLRSVAVGKSFRGEGLGTLVCDELEARAVAAGVETLYLLTTTATEFFSARGYQGVDRSVAPVAIQETTEFQDLCPSSANCLRKRLG